MSLEGADPARVAARYRLVLGGATLAMLVLSTPLWIEGADFPRVPFVPGATVTSTSASRVVFGLLLGTIGAATVLGVWTSKRRVVAVLDLASLAILTLLVLGDQHRFQPWVYLFLLSALALAAASPRRGIVLLRVLFLALYFHSGLSKLDFTFARELGQLFLGAVLRPCGVDAAMLPYALRIGLALAMPAAEIAIAAGLALPGTRRVACIAAAVLHLALVALLGPWSLGHSTILLVWNAALAAEVVVLFWPKLAAGEEAPTAWPETAARLVFGVAALMPLAERRGLWDTWPSFALYASHAERTEVWVHEDELAVYPESLRRHLRGAGPWRAVDLTGWSRDVRGTPVYPQGRAASGLAEALASRRGRPRLLRVRQWTRADRWTGRRTMTELFGLGPIRAWGDRCRLNAHPGAWRDRQ